MNIPLAAKTTQKILKQPELMCNMFKNTNGITDLYKCFIGTCAIITAIKRNWLNNIGICVCKCHYLGVTLEKIIIGIQMVEKHNMSKDQQTFQETDICNNTIKITFLLHNYKKSRKSNKEPNKFN